MSIPYEVSQKLIFSGPFVEQYDYSKSYWVGWPRFRSFKVKVPKYVDQEAIRKDNVRRTRQKIRRLVNCNLDMDRFMLLTFNKPVNSLTEANVYFDRFVKRLKRLYPDFKYLCVPEFTKLGRVHFHLICSIPFTSNDELSEVWGNGFAFLRKLNNVDNVGAYVCKYLDKSNFDPRYFRKRKFLYSFNLLKPLVLDTFNEVKQALKQIDNFFYELKKEFVLDTKYLGEIKYKQWVRIPIEPPEYLTTLSG